MQKTLFVKALIVFGLMLLIGLPLLMIQETIKERMDFRQEAVNSIAADSVREQTIIGPILVIPYTEQYDERVEVAKGDDKEAKSPVRTELLRRTVQRRFLVYPNDLQITGSIDTDRRYRGIHQVLVYSGQHAFKGDFTLPASTQLPRKSPDSRVTTGEPFVALSIEDVRGIRNIPKIDWGGQKIEFEQGTDLFAFRSGLHAPLGQIDRFSVGFIEPINVYSQSDRATKYGLLFVALTFAAFFIFEILKSLPIHPVQYLLVGLSLVIFFLLLVGLAEHIAFLAAYLIASAACIALTSFYLAHVLRNAWRGIGFGVALTLLYGALYGLLSSESNALVMGSILLFAVLAAIMVVTRKVDWYQVGKGPAQE